MPNRILSTLNRSIEVAIWRGVNIDELKALSEPRPLNESHLPMNLSLIGGAAIGARSYVYPARYVSCYGPAMPSRAS